MYVCYRGLPLRMSLLKTGIIIFNNYYQTNIEMINALRIAVIVILGFNWTCSFAQSDFDIPGASSVEVYKTVGDIQLEAWIYNPPEHNAESKASAIVFFFGGGWSSGNPIQFVKHCEYLAARGMVSIVVNYRVSKRHGVKANACVADAKSAIRWMRENADRLGIDPNRIVAAGGSAGGHLAAATATLPGLDDSIDDLSIDPVPNALALFNPAVILAKIEGNGDISDEAILRWENRMGVPLESISPYHHIRKGIGPTIIFHGTSDPTVPFKTVKMFDKAMDDVGNQCVLVAYEGEKHGFFNYRRSSNGPFIDTVHKLDKFLVDIGYLSPPPPVKTY